MSNTDNHEVLKGIKTRHAASHSELVQKSISLVSLDFQIPQSVPPTLSSAIAPTCDAA